MKQQKCHFFKIQNKKFIRIITPQKWKRSGEKKKLLFQKNKQEKIPGSKLRQGVKFPQH